MTGRIRTELLSDRHDRQGFSCGVAALDRYLKTQAGPDMRRRVSNCFVATDEATGAILGFYTLAAASIPMTDLPAAEAKKLPRYPTLPAVLLGRLAIDRHWQGRKLGGVLLYDAARRAALADPAAFALLVDAKDEAAAAFYRHHGFQPFANHPGSLFLALAAIARLLG